MKTRNTIGLIVGVILLVFFVFELFWAPNNFDGERFVVVSRGDIFTQIADSLEQAGIIRNRFLFTMAGRLLGYTTKLQVGRYRFTSGMSNGAILANLRYGTTIEQIPVMVPEGLRASRIARIFFRQLRIDTTRFVDLVHDPAFAESLGVLADNLEGFLMPDTYRFYWQDDENVIIRKMVGRFWEVFDDSLRQRAASMRKSIRNVVTLASIVEGETSVDSERAVVAGVYLNRLRKGMRLEADPTIQYLIDNGPRRLRRSDLTRESPYNTYRNYGLPPGPVNSPGREAIIAVLFPKHHRYLFFVAAGNGGHTFSRTYAEHQRAVRRYRAKRNAQEMRKPEG